MSQLPLEFRDWKWVYPEEAVAMVWDVKRPSYKKALKEFVLL